MSSPPFLGSKITLISKASIRYEGILYSVDTKNSTVALSKVRSFGTENRPCEKEVPPRDEVFEYIIFRGSDIHDIHVCEPPLSDEPQLLQQDPAIVTISQTTIPTAETQKHPTKNDTTDMTFSQSSRPPQQAQQKQNDHGVHETGGHVSGPRSSAYLNSNAPHKQVSPTPLLSASELNHAQRDPYKPNDYSNYRMQGQTPNSSSRPFTHRGGYGGQGGYSNYSSGTDAGYRPREGGYYSNATPRSSGRAYDSYSYGGQEGYSRMPYRYNSAPRYNNESTGAGISSGYRGSYRYGPTNSYTPRYEGYGYRQNSYSASGNNRAPHNRHQYKEDYDFETENAKIADELAKLGIGQPHKGEDDDIVEKFNPTNSYKDDERDTTQPHASGDKSEDSQHCYDKTKSFFDTISSESVDRANGVRITQMNRNEERRVNVETFGATGGHANYGGSYRGRGGPRKDMSNNYYNNRGGMHYGPRRGAPLGKSGSGWSSRIPATAQQY